MIKMFANFLSTPDDKDGQQQLRTAMSGIVERYDAGQMDYKEYVAELHEAVAKYVG
jgi:uncharacterized protein YbcV (DUF1398 family)